MSMPVPMARAAPKAGRIVKFETGPLIRTGTSRAKTLVVADCVPIVMSTTSRRAS